MLLYLIFFNALLTPELDSIIEQIDEGQKIPVIIRMAQEYPYDIIANLPIKERAMVLKNIAKESQKPLIDFLNEFVGEFDGLKEFWVYNGLYLNVTKRLIKTLSMRDDISFISHIPEIKLPPEEFKEIEPSRTPEWNIQKVMADSCWHRGYTGNGVIIGMIGSGIDTTHSALRGGKLIKWRDFQYNSPIPYDDDFGHGTACAGIICGGDGLGPFVDDIGVAPDAKLIVGRIVSPIDPLLGLQWIASLKADSGFNIKGMNNSWGTSNTIYFWDACRTLKSLDILPVFAIGNGGPNPYSTGSPGNYPLCIGVGATNLYDSIAIFSSRGPAPDSSPWNEPQYWYRPDWNLIKPDIVAPGVSVRVCKPGNSYVIVNGTSYSTPHITGAVAILCEADSSLNPTSLFNLILDNADRPSQGGPYPNNNYGWGRLNIWRALQTVVSIKDKKDIQRLGRIISITPNPFYKNTLIKIHHSDYTESLKLKIYDTSGKVVRSYYLKCRNQKEVVIHWNGEDDYNRLLPAGIYFMHLEFNISSGSKIFKSEKMVLIR